MDNEGMMMERARRQLMSAEGSDAAEVMVDWCREQRLRRAEKHSPATLLLTPEEAFECIGVGRTDGELPSVKLGRLRRIDVRALNAWLDGLGK